MILYVDIDGTICTNTDGNYKKATPLTKRIKQMNELYDSGNTITYWTARGSSQLHNVLRIEQYKRLTKSQLDEWGCRYHFLELGNKPQFDLFIDDKAKRIEEIK